MVGSGPDEGLFFRGKRDEARRQAGCLELDRRSWMGGVADRLVRLSRTKNECRGFLLLLLTRLRLASGSVAMTVAEGRPVDFAVAGVGVLMVFCFAVCSFRFEGRLLKKVCLSVLAVCLSGGLAGVPVDAHAQGAVYVNPMVTRISNSQVDTGPFSFLGTSSTSQLFGGAVIGGYYEVYHAPKYVVSLDLRDAIEQGNNASLNSFLFGVRVATSPDRSVYKPYAQVSVGDGRSRAPHTRIVTNQLVYDVAGGIDRTLSRHVDWRMIEVGYGSVNTISSSMFSSSQPTLPASRLLNFSAGLVFRIP